MSYRLRVAMLIQAYLPRIGGAERQLAAIAPLLHAQGVDVHILTRRYTGMKPFETIEGIPVYRLPIPGPKAIASLSYTAAALIQLRRLQPDVIHAHGVLSPATVAIAAKRLLHTPIIVTVHDRGPEGELARIRRRSLSSPRLAALREEVDAFVVISREVDREWAELGVPPERRMFIPNGVDTDLFAPADTETRSLLRAALQLPDVPIVIYSGRLVPGKQVDRLIGIWDSIRVIYPDALLLIVGSGSEEALLRRRAGAGVKFVGSVDNVADYLRAADLFVLPSASEGLSVALLEAMSTGLACITTAVGGNLDLIAHGVAGWLVPPDDVYAWEMAITTLLGDEPLRANLGGRARERVLRDYRLQNAAVQLHALYERVLTRREFVPAATL